MEYTGSAEWQKGCSNPRIAVLGIGNLLLQDEGVGVHSVQRLAHCISDDNVAIIDGGTFPDISLLIGENIDKLIIIDAVKGGGKPGTIYRFNLDEVDLDLAPSISLHEISVLNNLKMMALSRRQPKSIVVLGIEPKLIDFGLDLSQEVAEKLPEITKLVLAEIRQAYSPSPNPCPESETPHSHYAENRSIVTEVWKDDNL